MQPISIHLEGAAAFLVIFIILGIIIAALCILILPVFIVTAIMRRKVDTIARNRNGTVIAQYDPPMNLSPAEIGYLYDLEIGEKEIRATLFSLEQRNIIRFDSEKSVTVINQELLDAALPHEKLAVTIFGPHAPVFRTVPVIKNGVETYVINVKSLEIYDFKQAVKSTLATKGFPTLGFLFKRILITLFLSALIGSWPFFYFASKGSIINETYHDAWSAGTISFGLDFTLFNEIIFFQIHLTAALIMVHIWLKVAERHWLASKKIRKFWYEIEGYREFIKQVDLDNIQFNAQQNIKDSASATLPYAIALNLKTKWQNYFK